MNVDIRKKNLVLALLGLLSATGAQGQGDERLQQFLAMSLEDLMNLEITISTDTRKSLSKAPAVVTVITEEDIRATGATNLTDVLEGVPGIHVRANHFANRPLIHFRGANATQTLLMVDGVSMKDLMWGFGIFWKGLPASMIERVEIIRGPGSALFGADASAGVINVITKTAGRIDHSEAGVRVGSFDSKAVWLQHGADLEGIDFAVTAEFSDTDGHTPYIPVDAQSTQDQAFATDVSHAPGNARYGWGSEDLRFSASKGAWRLQAGYMRHRDLEVGLTGAGVLDPLTEAGDSRYNIGLQYRNEEFTRDWALDAEVRYQHLDYTSGEGFFERPAGYADATGLYPDGMINRMRSAEQQLNLEASGLYRGIQGHSLRLGAGYSWQDLYSVEQLITSDSDHTQLTDISDTANAFAPERARTIRYLFLQDIWTIDDEWELTAGARYDHYSDFGGSWNPRLALVWNTTERLTSKLMYGRAFRAPSYQELFAATSFTRPNPDLSPERSQTFELSFAYAVSPDLHLGMNAYHLEMSDLIRATGSPRQFQNTGDHTIDGIELELLWQAMPDLRITANYTHRNQEDNQFRSFDEPDQEAYLRADWGFRPNWQWNLQSNWVGERARPAGDGREPVDDYLITDSTIRYTGLREWEFAFSIRNLFDVDAREYTGRAIPDDLPLAGRTVYAELRYRF